jgi:hypothetical protein
MFLSLLVHKRWEAVRRFKRINDFDVRDGVWLSRTSIIHCTLASSKTATHIKKVPASTNGNDVLDGLLCYWQLLFFQLVTVNFWVLNSVLDPALIEDTHVLQDHVPSWMNHSLHTVVLLFALAELLLTYRRYPRWTVPGRLTSAVVVLAYTSWCVDIAPCDLRSHSCTQ